MNKCRFIDRKKIKLCKEPRAIDSKVLEYIYRVAPHDFQIIINISESCNILQSQEFVVDLYRNVGQGFAKKNHKTVMIRKLPLPEYFKILQMLVIIKNVNWHRHYFF